MSCWRLRSTANNQYSRFPYLAEQFDLGRAEAQAESGLADVRAAESELSAATADLQRFEALLRSTAGSRQEIYLLRKRACDRHGHK